MSASTIQIPIDHGKSQTGKPVAGTATTLSPPKKLQRNSELSSWERLVLDKIKLLDAIERSSKETDPEARMVRGALRHAACRMIRGQTIRHRLHRCKVVAKVLAHTQQVFREPFIHVGPISCVGYWSVRTALF